MQNVKCLPNESAQKYGTTLLSQRVVKPIVFIAKANQHKRKHTKQFGAPCQKC